MGSDREKRLEVDPSRHELDGELTPEQLDEPEAARPGRRTLVDPQRAEATAPRPAVGRTTLAEADGGSPPPWTAPSWSHEPSALDGFCARGLDEVLTALAAVPDGRGLVAATLSAAYQVARPSRPSLTSRPSPPDPAGQAMWRTAERRAATLYRRAVDDGELTADDPAVDEALARLGGGQALPATVQRRMELELGVSLGRVRVHTDAVAEDAARAVRAKAFTVGEDIFFAAGAYAPETAAGQQLLAHELAHVIQAYEGRAATGGSGITVSRPEESLEREADAMAARLSAASPAGTEARARARAPEHDAPPLARGSRSDARILRQVTGEQASSPAGEETRLRRQIAELDAQLGAAASMTADQRAQITRERDELRTRLQGLELTSWLVAPRSAAELRQRRLAISSAAPAGAAPAGAGAAPAGAGAAPAGAGAAPGRAGAAPGRAGAAPAGAAPAGAGAARSPEVTRLLEAIRQRVMERVAEVRAPFERRFSTTSVSPDTRHQMEAEMRTAARPFLDELRDPAQPPDRFRHPQEAIRNEVRAALELEGEGNAEEELQDQTAHGPDGPRSRARRTGNLATGSWCGAFAYTQQHRAGLLNTEAREALHATGPNSANIDQFLRYEGSSHDHAIWTGTRWQPVREYHAERGSLRQLTLLPDRGNPDGTRRGAPDLSARGTVRPIADVDIQPGDIILVDNAVGTYADHIAQARSYDRTTGMLETIDGNANDRIAISAPRDLNQNPATQTVAEGERKPSRVYAYGRFSLVDYEVHHYLPHMPADPTQAPEEPAPARPGHGRH